MKWNRVIIAILIFILIGLIGLTFIKNDPVEIHSDIKEENPAVIEDSYSLDFTLKNLKDEDVSLGDFRGKYVILNFWTTWCGFCDNWEVLDMLKGEENLVVLNINYKEDKSTIEKYINESGYGFEVLLDEDGTVAAKYLVNVFPTFYCIDKEGVQIGEILGKLEYNQMIEVIENIREGEDK